MQNLTTKSLQPTPVGRFSSAFAVDIRLTATKERLWNLVFLKAGVMRPKSNQGRARLAPVAVETPQEPDAIPA
jgi:hypothetical protein